MRTTLTLDDDVAAVLRRLQHSRGASLKQVVNEVLRLGIAALGSPRKKATRFRTPEVSVGRLLISLESTPEALAIAEGEDHR
jgi:hypothetical protein